MGTKKMKSENLILFYVLCFVLIRGYFVFFCRLVSHLSRNAIQW